MSRIGIYVFFLLFCACAEKKQEPQEAKAQTDKQLVAASAKIEHLEAEQTAYKSLTSYVQTRYTPEDQSLCEYALQDILGLKKLAELEIPGLYYAKTSLLINKLHVFDSRGKGLYAAEGSLSEQERFLWSLFQLYRGEGFFQRVYQANKACIIKQLRNGVYEQSGMKQVVEALFFAYEKLESQDLDALYKQLQESQDPSATVEALIDEEILALLPIFASTSNKEQELEGLSAEEQDRWLAHDATWAYSFWLRRHGEKNINAVYTILRDIDASL